jgi:hypothetical protein
MYSAQETIKPYQTALDFLKRSEIEKILQLQYLGTIRLSIQKR